MELIKITGNNGKQAVSARDLHSFLEIETRFDSKKQKVFKLIFNQLKNFVKTCK